MKALHLLQHRKNSEGGCLGLYKVRAEREEIRYTTGYWSFGEEEAKKLIGGYIFLHETKKSPSFIGGLVEGIVSVREEDVDPRDKNRFVFGSKNRVKFQFEKIACCKGVKWRGENHRRAWKSGFLPVDSCCEK